MILGLEGLFPEFGLLSLYGLRISHGVRRTTFYVLSKQYPYTTLEVLSVFSLRPGTKAWSQFCNFWFDVPALPSTLHNSKRAESES